MGGALAVLAAAERPEPDRPLDADLARRPAAAASRCRRASPTSPASWPRAATRSADALSRARPGAGGAARSAAARARGARARPVARDGDGSPRRRPRRGGRVRDRHPRHARRTAAGRRSCSGRSTASCRFSAATCGCSPARSTSQPSWGSSRAEPVARHGRPRMGADRLHRLRWAACAYRAAPPAGRRRPRLARRRGVRGRGRRVQPAARAGIDTARDLLRAPRARHLRARWSGGVAFIVPGLAAHSRAVGALPRGVAAGLDPRRRRRHGSGGRGGRRARGLGSDPAEPAANRGLGPGALGSSTRRRAASWRRPRASGWSSCCSRAARSS